MKQGRHHPVTGAGLGLRRALLSPLTSVPEGQIDFMEVAPENWINVGGRLGKQFRAFTERYDFTCHGLSLSLGSPAPLDWQLLGNIKRFMAEHGIRAYSEHLSYCSDDAHLYDLLPIPFTADAVKYVAKRIRQIQDFLEQPLIIEHVSYYAAPQQEMTEAEFLQAVLEEADCLLLLDVNNIYVNSINHGYDADAFLAGIPGERIAYGHIAGHYVEAPDLRVDTHGTEVIDPVWQLLKKAYDRFGVFPTLLERDFNFPETRELLDEVSTVRKYQDSVDQRSDARDAGRRHAGAHSGPALAVSDMPACDESS